MKKPVFAALILLALTGFGGTADAANTTAPKSYSGGLPRTIFPFQGKACPPGSRLYTGPEEDEIEKTGSGYLYCIFERRYAMIRKKGGVTTCPDGKDPVPTSRAPKDIMWCDLPKATFARNGALRNIDGSPATSGSPPSVTPAALNASLVTSQPPAAPVAPSASSGKAPPPPPEAALLRPLSPSSTPSSAPAASRGFVVQPPP